MPRFQYILFLVFLIQTISSAILDNCLRYTTPTINNKPICSECRDGFYLNADSCILCLTLNASTLCSQPSVVNQQSSNKQTITLNAQSKNESLNSQVGPVLYVNTESKNSVPLKLQNCKEADLLGVCNICFPHYKLNIQKICIKEQSLNFQNCLVFSEITNQCLMCDDTYIMGEKGACLKGLEGEAPKNNLTAFVIALNTTLIQIDKVSELSQGTIKNPEQKQKKEEYSRKKIDQLKELPSISLKQLNEKKSAKNSANNERESSLQSNKNLSIVLVKNGSSNGENLALTILSISQDEDEDKEQEEKRLLNCLEYTENICKKCKNGFFYNFLQNKCEILNKPIQFRNSSLNQTRGSNQTFQVNDSIKSSNISQSPTNSSLPNGTSTLRSNTSISNRTSIENNGISNITIKNATRNTFPNNSNSLNLTSPSSTKNSSVSTETNPTNIKNNTQAVNMVNGTLNATNKSNTTNNSTITSAINKTMENSTKLNITTKVDPITNLTIKIIGSTTNPPKKLPFCIKYRQLTYECIQCQEDYNLYNGNCYDDYQFRQLTKNKRIFYNQVGI